MDISTLHANYDAAVTQAEEGSISEAVTALELLTVEAPEFALPYSALSMYYFKQGLYEKSLASATRVCELEPDDTFSYVALSLLAQKTGDNEAAEQALSRAREIQFQRFQEIYKQREEQRVSTETEDISGGEDNKSSESSSENV